MLTFELNQLNKVRVWFNLSKDLLINDSVDSICKKIESIHFKDFTNKDIMLELLLPRGGRIIYGALGVSYESSKDKVLAVKINSTDFPKKKFNEALIEPLEHAYIGLPIEYGTGILQELIKFHESGRLQLSGSLKFCYGAYADVSSNTWIFRKLTFMLINLLGLETKNISKDFLIKLCEEFEKE